LNRLTKIEQSLQTDLLAIFENDVESVNAWYLTGETKEDIVLNIEGNIEEVLDVGDEMTFVGNLFYGYFKVKLGEN
jgi:hypothetical protein